MEVFYSGSVQDLSKAILIFDIGEIAEFSNDKETWYRGPFSDISIMEQGYLSIDSWYNYIRKSKDVIKG